MQRLCNRIQLVIAGQSSPTEGFPTTSVHSVANGAAYVPFDYNQLGITRDRDKGGADVGSAGVTVGGVSLWGTVAKAPTSSRKCWRNCASISMAGLAMAFKKWS